MKKILITGGSGFTGSYILEALTKKYDVYNADIYPKKNFPINKQIITDLSNEYCKDKLKNYNFNTIIHTAGLFNSKENIKKTTLMDKIITNFCSINNINLIYFSTFLINITPSSEYSKLKLKNESNILSNVKKFVIVRPETIYNKNEKKILFYKRFKIFNCTISFPNKKVFRSPTHIDDMSNFIEKILEENKFTNKIYNFGGPKISYENILKKCNSENLKVFNIPFTIKYFLKFILSLKFGKSIIDSQELDRIVNTEEVEKDYNIKFRKFCIDG